MEAIKLTQLDIGKIRQFKDDEDKKGVYFGIWKFSEIINAIKFTYREPIDFNIFQENSLAQEKKYPEFDTDYYQRLFNDERTKNVISFLLAEIKSTLDNKNETQATFPTSLILSLYISEATNIEEYKQEWEEVNEETFFEGSYGVYFDLNNLKIFLPNRNVMLVVDGQHRLAGMFAIYKAIKSLLEVNSPLPNNLLDKKLIDYAQKNLKKEFTDLNDELLERIKLKIENFQFSSTILLDFDIWEQAKVFADVNFNQKPVNKSLYYDIFGSYPSLNRNDIYLAHDWTVFLNSSENSPLFRKIKMLGRGDGYFSQASFVEALLPFFRKNGIWEKIVSDFILHESISDRIPKFLNAYFKSIKEIFNDYWPAKGIKASDYKDVLLKTTGLGAVIKIIPFIYKQLEGSLTQSEEVLIDSIIDIFNEKLQVDNLAMRLEEYVNKLRDWKKKYENDGNNLNKINQINKLIEQALAEKEEIIKKVSGEFYFSRNGEFSKGTGKGAQDRLYKKLALDLGFITITKPDKDNQSYKYI